MGEPKFWITGINPEKYNIEKAFGSLLEIDLYLDVKADAKVKAKEEVKVGDIVYIYQCIYPYPTRKKTNKEEFVNFKTVVVATDIEPKDKIDDRDFITEKGVAEISEIKKFTRLKLLQTFPDSLHVSALTARSLNLKKNKTQLLQHDCIEYMRLGEHAVYFPKGCFSYLIDKCSKDKSSLVVSSQGSKSRKSSKKSKTSPWEGIAENVRLVLPELVSWVRSGYHDLPYFELLGVVANAKKVVPIEVTMEVIHDVLSALSKETRQEIPTLNGMVTNFFTSLPSHKFDYVLKGYEDLNNDVKLRVKEGYNAKALLYKNWDWVLSMLGIGHNVEKELIQKAHKPSSGWSKEEEEEIKELKLKILQNPEDQNIHSNIPGEIDYLLLSGDRVDLYFPDIYTALVIIPSTASEDDVFRGINQCVKFKALLEAEAKYKGDFNLVEVFLGISDELTPKMLSIAKYMGVQYKEHLGWTEEQIVNYLRGFR